MANDQACSTATRSDEAIKPLQRYVFSLFADADIPGRSRRPGTLRCTRQCQLWIARTRT